LRQGEPGDSLVTHGFGDGVFLKILNRHGAYSNWLA
jgi:hypothetical protein